MDFGMVTDAVSCIVGGFGIAYMVWIIAAAVRIIYMLILGHRGSGDMLQ